MQAQRYPFSVSLIGVLHKEKRKMYMTSVLWSDQNEIVVFRTYPDFKNVHKQLKKAFPTANKMKKSDRVLPKFRDKRVTAGTQNKGPAKSLQRLKFLQKYCNDLLSCDPQVCQSADLIQFFHPKEEDLQPEFAKNCVMILPSDDEVSGDTRQVKGGNVTQPFVTETYRCVAPYETKDTKNKPFKVALDEKVDVLIKDQAGWWLVENEDKKMAWFPAPYLEKLDDDDDDEDDDDTDGSPARGAPFTAVKSYTATKADEITVAIGSVVELLQRSANGWWLIRYNGKAGYIPAMYLQPYNFHHIRMAGNHQGRRLSSPNQIPSPTLELQSNQLSLSHGNLLLLLPNRSSSPNLLPPSRQHRSHSLNLQSELPHFRPSADTIAPTAKAAISPTTPKSDPPPTIMVEMDGEKEQRGMSPRPDSDGSFSSDSDFRDDLNSSWASSSSFNLSKSYNEDQLRLSRTPPPTQSNHLSPTSISQGGLMPSVSDLYKGPTAPKVPPRPQAQEILTRCTTVTRKNASKSNTSPTQTEIISR